MKKFNNIILLLAFANLVFTMGGVESLGQSLNMIQENIVLESAVFSE
jgi:hypothetical protein